MAKLKHGIFGPISGKIGPVVGGVWNGIPYLRKVPRRKKNATKTEAQLNNEQKFKFGNNWMVPFHPYMTVGFQNVAIQKTAISAAFSANYKHVITGSYPNFGIDYSKVKISTGNLPGLNNLQVELTAPDTLELSWEGSLAVHAVFNDQVMLVVYSPALTIADGFIGSAERRDRYYAFKLNPGMVGTPLEVYVSVASFDRKKIAESSYMGKIMPL